MTELDISARVIDFLAESIDSVPQLEALLLLWREPNKWWGVEELGARLYVSTADADGIVRALCTRRLVTSEGQPPLYRYSTDWDQSGTLLPEVYEAYRHNLVRVTTFIHSRASSAVRAFARAFEMKKDR
ncbi:MAG: hypothetical protein SXG53_27685 [Pseudomonadota bacterium]|nr:hypothetical protein [Pseudomonadota bacterium]